MHSCVAGWSDLCRTISDEQIPLFASKCVELLTICGGDGVDLDWEHLSDLRITHPQVYAQQRAVLGKTVSALRHSFDQAFGSRAKLVSVTLRYGSSSTLHSLHSPFLKMNFFFWPSKKQRYNAFFGHATLPSAPRPLSAMPLPTDGEGIDLLQSMHHADDLDRFNLMM
jgi:hypothetical protein